MLKVAEIRELIRLVDQSNISEFKYEVDGLKLKMKKSSPAQNEGVQAPVQIEQPLPQPVITQAPITHTDATPVVPVTVEVEQAPAAASREVNENLHKITSPMVGTFYGASSPDAESYVKVGSHVKKDSIVCIVEAMKLFNEIEAEVEGEIVEILVKNGQLVEYGQPLFLVKAN